mmetsp:Transcript_45488/g.95504  ORF Transcript_45488/g.95504 Transcript_45488/m.95504 type:complete len:1040 (-) Transcript_45488:73-3192(-)
MSTWNQSKHNRSHASEFKNDDERRQRWQKFMADLEDECGVSNTTPPNTEVEARKTNESQNTSDESDINDTPRLCVSVESLYMQQLMRGMGHSTSTSTNHGPSIVEQKQTLTEMPLPSALALRDFIEHYKQCNVARCEFIDRVYLEKTARLALSMAKKLLELYNAGSGVLMSYENITVDNVYVSDTETGEVEFVNLAASTDYLSTSSKQRKIIYALGRIYYEVFTHGSLPLTPASVSEPSSFDAALEITDDDADKNDDENSGELQNREKQVRRVSDTEGRDASHYETLRAHGLPPSICRLIAHMLENEEGLGGIFCSDQSVATLLDVVWDLEQMVDDPNSFLHDSMVLRLEPIISDKLYGRSKEVHQCLEVADAVHQRGKISTPEVHSQSVIMISGFSGSGKSSLVKELKKHLGKKGWQCLHCKFDQEVRPRPLSTIASAFSTFLEYDVCCKPDSSEQKEFKNNMHEVFDLQDLETLCKLIPTLRKLVPAFGKCPNQNETFNAADADASKHRLHRLLSLLTKALSDQYGPLLLFMDDIQWADPSSIELICSLMENSLCNESIEETPAAMNHGSNILFVGCYRSYAVAESNPLTAFIRQIKDCDTITLDEINLDGLSKDVINAFISDSLFYPKRLTRSLATLVHQKSAGNPLFAKEFLNSLATENLLTYSLSKHKWQYDEDIIKMKTVSTGVADLLTKRLERVQKNVLDAVRVISCFGSAVSLEILRSVNGVYGNSDIIASLNSAVDELLIKKFKESYSFVHDAIQYAVYQGMEPEERVGMLKELADTLIARTSEGRTNAILFIIVDLINKVGPSINLDADDRKRYAELNLAAGEKAIHTPDFSSANSYIESGIKFLGDNSWDTEYDLSLALYKNSAAVKLPLGKTVLMEERLNEVFDNARVFEDKLDSMSVLIQFLTTCGKADKALEHSVSVLQYLGEPLSLSDSFDLKRELLESCNFAQQLSSMSFEMMPKMKDPMKIKAMVSLSSLACLLLLCFVCQVLLFFFFLPSPCLHLGFFTAHALLKPSTEVKSFCNCFLPHG